MAVVINQPDALAPLNSAAEGFTAGRDKTMALALAKEKQSADIRQKDRSLDLQQQKTESDIVAQKSQTAIAEAQEAYRKRVEPLLEAEAKAHLEGAQSEVRLKNLQIQVAQIDADFAQQLHASGLDMAQVRQKMQETQTAIQRNVAQTLQANQATANAKAEEPGVLAQQRATLASTNATTGYTNSLAAHVGQTGGSGGMNFSDALSGYTRLSPAGQKIVDDVESGAMTPRAGALAAKKLGAEGQNVIAVFSNMDPDKAGKDTSKADSAKRVTSNPAFGRLPGSLQAMIVKELKGGATIQGIAQDIKAAKDKDGNARFDANITSLVDALAGAPPTSGGWGDINGGGGGGSPRPPAAPGATPAPAGPQRGQYNSVSPTPPAGSTNPFSILQNAFPHAFQGYQGR